MRPAERLVSLVTEHSAVVVAVMVLLSVGVGSGMAFLDDTSGLEQFQFESEESEALTYIEDSFEAEDEGATTVQVVLRSDDNVLTRESLLATLDLQQEFRDDPEINRSLASDEAFADLSSVVATAAIQQERGAELEAEQTDLEERGDELEQQGEELEQRGAELEEVAGTLADGLNETRDLEEEFVALNASFERGEIDEQSYEAEAERLSGELDTVGDEAPELLDDESRAGYESLREEVRRITGELAAVEVQYEQGELTESERDERVAELEAELGEVYDGVQTAVLGDEFAELEQRGEELDSEREAVEQRGEELEQRAEELQRLDPSIDDQRQALESMSDEEVEEVIATVLGEDAPREALVFVPTDFDRGSTETDARQLFVTQTTDEEIVEGEAPPGIVDSQLAISDHVDERLGDDAFVFGAGVISDEIERSMADSMAIVLPLALLFVLVVLSIAYRDPLDIFLGMFGIALVLVWTFGFMGWADIAFNQIMIAVPVLLVGLSIDYAIHVFMRHREQRANGHEDPRQSMRVVLLGLGAALVWVTVTAVLGFLSNLVSPVAPIREFGLVSAFGIAATLLVFGTFVPAAKVGLDSFLEARGWDRRKRAFGTGGGVFTRLLSGGRTVARRMPVVVVLLALLVTAGGAYGATQVDTTFEQEDFIADEPPEWTTSLPEPFAPGEYTVKSNLEFVNERFLRQDSQTQVLLERDITDDDTLTGIDEASTAAAEQDVVVTLSDGEPDVRSPLSVMRTVAGENETFAETFRTADTDGDDVPDGNLTALFDALFEAAPDRASDVIYRSGGEYESARMVLSIQGDATAAEATDATRTVAASLDRADSQTIATGQLVVFNIVEDELFDTVIESLLITMVTVFLFLMIAYRVVHGSTILGAVTLMPILLTVAWILGTMSLLGIPFNVMTGTITSLTIGLGVAYSVHMSERYRLELDRGQDVWAALERSVTGTGGALLGSAATTAGGFGVLALAILPPLQQFGIITGLTIIYAFLASVFVLPSFLVLWTRYLGPAEHFPDGRADGSSDDGSQGTAADVDAARASPVSNGGPVTITEYDPPSGGAPSTRWRPSMGQQRARPAEPTRVVEPSVLAPGSPYTVTLTVPLAPGLTVLTEQPPGTHVSVETFGPEPLDAAATDGTVTVEWDVDSEALATVRFTGQLPRSVTGSATFSGSVSTADSEAPVAGESTLDVVSNTRADAADEP